MSVYPSGATALRGRYLVKNRAVNAFLRIRDALLRSASSRRKEAGRAKTDRIVLGVGGQLGDAVIATSVLRPLAAAFPGTQIGVVCPSAAAVVFDGHPLVRWIHHREHWFASRADRQPRLMGRRLRLFVQSEGRLRREIQAIGYDVSLDLYPFFPNHSRLFWGAGIPIRVGYVSGGDGPLLTHPMQWRDSRQHTSLQHLALVQALDPAIATETWAYDLPLIPDKDCERGARLLENSGVSEGSYIVIHPGTGNPLKAWPRARWSELVDRLSTNGSDNRATVVMTGAGKGERHLIDELVAQSPGTVSLCDQTTWQTFRYVIANARIVIGSDSVATHIAAAHGVPCVAIMAAMSDPEHWRPSGPLAVALTADVPCAPCFQSRGCSTMACVRDVSVARVGAAVDDLRHATAKAE
jgi:ADP-heptose:LPS heptosyltransferase